jgi:hypothetical protein
MSPRYFAKFTGSAEQTSGNWYNFSGIYAPGSPEEKISKWKIVKFIAKITKILIKIFRIKQ